MLIDNLYRIRWSRKISLEAIAVVHVNEMTNWNKEVAIGWGKSEHIQDTI